MVCSLKKIFITKLPLFRSVRIGIICAVMTIKHIAFSTSDDSTNLWSDKSSEDFEENTMSEKGRRALPYLGKHDQMLPFFFL